MPTKNSTKLKNIPDARTQPHNLESEQCILGCALIDQNATISIMANLNPDDFYMEAHRIIFDSMLSAYNNKMPVDFVTVMS